MFTLASQTFANGVWTLTPEEPATIQLAVIGFAMLATYAVVTGWRPTRRTIVANAPSTTEGHRSVPETTTRRAA